MKKLLPAVCLFLVMLSLAGCSGQQSSETDMTAGDIAAAIQQSQSELPELSLITAGNPDFTTWLSDYYFLQPEQVADGAICYADGVEACEIAVLILKDEKDNKTASEALNEYIQNRAGVFEGYAPKQAAMVKEGIVAPNGRYIALLICPDPQSAKEAFLDCFGKAAGSGGVNTGSSESDAVAEVKSGEEENTDTVSSSEAKTPEVSAEDENSYDAEAILQSYRSGDSSSLSEMNRSILDAAKDVIAEKISDDMSDYEKELAIHDYITGWSEFDYGVFGRSADNIADVSETPYGVLINRSAMCHGYSSTFQLLMDMLDIECVTVLGTPSGSGVRHSWNMVKLDEDWYCVDCAWDDPIGGSPNHRYFNVTSDDMRGDGIHYWDEASVPEAKGTAYSYGGN